MEADLCGRLRILGVWGLGNLQILSIVCRLRKFMRFQRFGSVARIKLRVNDVFWVFGIEYTEGEII